MLSTHSEYDLTTPVSTAGWVEKFLTDAVEVKAAGDLAYVAMHYRANETLEFLVA